MRDLLQLLRHSQALLNFSEGHYDRNGIQCLLIYTIMKEKSIDLLPKKKFCKSIQCILWRRKSSFVSRYSLSRVRSLQTQLHSLSAESLLFLFPKIYNLTTSPVLDNSVIPPSRTHCPRNSKIQITGMCWS